jgi:hypothetical protein
MPYDEFIGWFRFFQARPPEWRDDNRAYSIMSALGVTAKSHEVFGSLRAIKKAEEEKELRRSELDVQTSKLQSSGFLGYLLGRAQSNGVDWVLSDQAQG